MNNRNEWIADSQPTNGTHFFHATTVTRSSNAVDLTFVTSTTRLYEVDVNDVALTNDATWTTATNFSRGQDGQTTWQDGTSTNSLRFYRIDVGIP